MADELHITGVLVHVQPASQAEVCSVITGLAEARIHADDGSGKLVVTLEAPSAGAIVDQVALIQQTPGVLGVAMVYQHAESLDSLNTEIPHVDHPT